MFLPNMLSQIFIKSRQYPMTSPTLMYSTPIAQRFNKKAQQLRGNHSTS